MRYATRSEQRLAELEGLRRRLTEEEEIELRKCLHAIYMHQWRAERMMHEAALKEHRICPDTLAQAEVEGIARRMADAHDDGWPLPKAHDWQDHARTASAQLRDTILRAQGKLERVAA
jgi:hypothetical protein